MSEGQTGAPVAVNSLLLAFRFEGRLLKIIVNVFYLSFLTNQPFAWNDKTITNIKSIYTIITKTYNIQRQNASH